jgi:hypothetical protein
MSKNITVKKAKDAMQNLRKLTPSSPKLDDDLEMTVKEAVFFMAPELVQMTKRGFTFKELSDGLAREDFHIKAGTLNRYLNEYQSAKESVDKPTAALKLLRRGTSSLAASRTKLGPSHVWTKPLEKSLVPKIRSLLRPVHK